MSFTLAGRNAVVTGSARGMGAQFALDLSKAGANVLLVEYSAFIQINAECLRCVELYIAFFGPQS